MASEAVLPPGNELQIGASSGDLRFAAPEDKAYTVLRAPNVVELLRFLRSLKWVGDGEPPIFLRLQCPHGEEMTFRRLQDVPLQDMPMPCVHGCFAIRLGEIEAA